MLQVLAEAERGVSVKNQDLADTTQLEPERLNDAVTILEDNGLVESYVPIGTAPFSFHTVTITPAGRLEWERAITKVQTDSRESEPNDPRPLEGRVFLVHGHDEGLKDKVARFLERLELDVIVLHEQPNKGRTIIEKFIDYSNVAYAVVLLTPDDQGGLRKEKYGEQKPRARQNVILELGFFLGKLGRERVCALYQEGVEIPSDYQGVLYVVIDQDGAWRIKLGQEMKAAGLPVDLNRVV